MICVSLAGVDKGVVEQTLAKEELVELRLDQLSLGEALPDLIKNSKAQIIVTFRPGKEETEADKNHRRDVLTKALESGAHMVDVEIDSDNQYRGRMLRAARSNGKKIMFSYHNFDRTPAASELQKLTQQGFEIGGDVVKIATQIKRREDNLKLLSLLDDPRPVVVVGMGPQGTVTRIVAPLLGSPFSFASLDEQHKTATGQLTVTQMREIFSTLWRFGLR